MVRHLLVTLTLLILAVISDAQTSLQGKVTDAESGQPIIFGTVALYKNGVLVTGTETDLDGFYSLTALDPGTYEVEFSYIGYSSVRITNVQVSAGKANKLDQKLSSGITIETIIVTWTKPLVEQDNTTQGQTLTSEEIKKLPTRNVNAIASLAAGVATSDEGAALNIRGSRSDATNYYIDGIRVSGRSIPKSEIEQLQVITGGMEARYGDVTGGIVSITSKGASDKFNGGIEVESSRYLDPYDHNLVNLNFSGPIWKKKGETVLGYRVAGQFQYNKEDNPPAIPVYQIRDDVRKNLEEKPITLVGNTLFPTAEYVDYTGVDTLKSRRDEQSHTLDLTGRLDFSVTRNIDLSISGTYYDVKNKFTPGGWQVFNSHNNPTLNDERYRTNIRLRHRLGSGPSAGGQAAKGSVIQNAVYVLQFGYEKSKVDVADKRHGDNLFDYGYIGKYNLGWDSTIITRFILTDVNTIILFPAHVDYTRTFKGFTPSGKNEVLTRYILNASDLTNFNSFPVINGRVPTNLSNVWTNLHTNIGTVYNSNFKRDNDLYTFNANTSFDLVPKGFGGARHNIQFGVIYEQRVNRNYNVAPSSLWTAARLHANEHIEGQGLDSSKVVSQIDGKYLEINLFTGDTVVKRNIKVPIFAPKTVTTNTENLFFKRIRERLNVPVNQYVNIDGLDPSLLSLDLFSARELNDLGFVNYVGYDYLGNRVDGISFEDFFTATDANGIRTFPVAANRPNYQAAYVQDKFTFKDIIFRLGLRVDRFDANTKVLKDPYSLYDIMNAGDFSSRFNTVRPGNIGNDFKVYVSSEGGTTVKAYRQGDTWYQPNGNPVNDGSQIFGGGLVFPRYAVDDETKRDITDKNFDPDISFSDYKPQVNWMPRLAFSFPISEEANFFAHYDVNVQRPSGFQYVSPLTYFYWETSGSGIRSNANLKPERTVDYEVGFKQKLSNFSALTLSAYYKELRDMIQSRYILYVPSPVNQYETYDNLDFATIKGFSAHYDLRRTGNVSMNLTYTLQFADGTGSDANSSRGLSSRGIQRTLFPMNYDERHMITGIFDFRYGSGKLYNGPSIGGLDIFSNTGLNVTWRATSGRPYTAAVEPDVLGAQGIVGSVNGSRLPWNFTLNAQIDKTFIIGEGGPRAFGLNVYLRVSNLLDNRNIINVYRYTGSPNDDGFLNSAKGQVFLANGFSQGQSLDAYLAAYQWRLQNSDFYSLPRRIYLGAVFDF